MLPQPNQITHSNQTKMISKKELLQKANELTNNNLLLHESWNDLMQFIHSLPDDQPDLLPFQYPVPDGYEVVTRDGRKVQVHKFEGATRPIVGIVVGNTATDNWYEKGMFRHDKETNSDLFLRLKEKSHDDKIFISIMEDFFNKSYNHSERGIGENPLPEAFQRLKTYFTTLKPVV